MRNTILTLFVILIPITAFAAESYLCAADMATGFSFDKATKQWNATTFKPDKKYIVNKSLSKKATWEVKEVGTKYPLVGYKEDFSSEGYLYCNGFLKFKMNNKSLRFLSAYLMGYYEDYTDQEPGEPEEGEDTPYIAIGKCSPL